MLALNVHENHINNAANPVRHHRLFSWKGFIACCAVGVAGFLGGCVGLIAGGGLESVGIPSGAAGLASNGGIACLAGSVFMGLSVVSSGYVVVKKCYSSQGDHDLLAADMLERELVNLEENRLQYLDARPNESYSHCVERLTAAEINIGTDGSRPERSIMRDGNLSPIILSPFIAAFARTEVIAAEDLDSSASEESVMDDRIRSYSSAVCENVGSEDSLENTSSESESCSNT